MGEESMELPDGETTEMCVNFPKCNKIFGCRKGSTQCDFSPSRYVKA